MKTEQQIRDAIKRVRDLGLPCGLGDPSFHTIEALEWVLQDDEE